MYTPSNGLSCASPLCCCTGFELFFVPLNYILSQTVISDSLLAWGDGRFVVKHFVLSVNELSTDQLLCPSVEIVFAY